MAMMIPVHVIGLRVRRGMAALSRRSLDRDCGLQRVISELAFELQAAA